MSLVPLQPNPTWDERWDTEEARRNQEQLRIASLLEPERSFQLRTEKLVRDVWDRENPRPG